MIISWANAILVISGLIVLLILVRWHADKKNPFDARDLLMDHKTNRASIDKGILFLFATLSAWVVVTWTLDDKNVETLLLGVLAVFIVQRTASKAIDTYAATRPEGGAEEPREIERK